MPSHNAVTDVETPDDPSGQLVGFAITGAAGVVSPANRSQIGAVGWAVIKADGTTVAPPQEEPMTAKPGSNADGTPVDLAKALDATDPATAELVRSMLAKSALEVADAQASAATALAKADQAIADAAAATAAASAERDARLTGEYIAKAAAYGALPTTPDALAPVLRAVDELLPAEIAAEVSRLLASANESAGFSALTKTSGGRPVAPSTGAPSALGRAQAAAAVLRKSDPTIDEGSALLAVLDADPALASAYSAEQSAAAGRR